MRWLEELRENKPEELDIKINAGYVLNTPEMLWGHWELDRLIEIAERVESDAQTFHCILIKGGKGGSICTGSDIYPHMPECPLSDEWVNG